MIKLSTPLKFTDGVQVCNALNADPCFFLILKINILILTVQFVVTICFRKKSPLTVTIHSTILKTVEVYRK